MMKVTYSVDYQHLRKGAKRPDDDGIIVPLESTGNPLLLLPSVGDYVNIAGRNEELSHFCGRVKSKLFTYTRIPGDIVHCGINIIVEEVDMDWDKLINE